MRRLVFLIVYIGLVIGIASCCGGDPIVDPIIDTPVEENNRPQTLEEYNQVTEGLKDYFLNDEYFEIGVAIEPGSVSNSSEANLMKRHFSSLTAENVMKWSSLQPSEGTFRFDNADKIVNFAQSNGMKVRGHTLCWHQQVPDWVFEENGTTASKEKVLERLRTHISTVVNHFKGKVYVWDVVNEAIDDGSSTYKNTKWYNICGEDYIIEAFKAAREADSDVKLFYNDYSATQATKRDKIYGLVQKLKNQNLIDGVGLQGHWNINAPSNELITAAFNKYKSLGVEIQITELDVSVYPNSTDTESTYTTDLEAQQAIVYSRFFKLFRLHKEAISSVTFWGLLDKHSWLNNWPVKGRDNYPLLFDSNQNPKEAYFSVIDF